MTTPLIISQVTRDEIRRVREHAKAFPLGVRELHRMSTEPGACIGNDPKRRLLIPMGFRCVFSIEQLERNPRSVPIESSARADQDAFVWCTHLSVSMLRPGRLPTPRAVLMIAMEFGMNQRKEPLTFTEKTTASDGTPTFAINVVAEMEPEDAPR